MKNIDIANHNLKVAINWEWEYKKYRWRPRTRNYNIYIKNNNWSIKTILKYENR